MSQERIKEIEAMLRQRQQGIVREEDEFESDGPLSERDEAIRLINLRRQKEIKNDEADARISQEMAEDDFQQQLAAEEEREWDAESESEANLMDSDVIFESFSELSAEEGGYSDLVVNGKIPQALIDAIDVKIAEGEYSPNDWTVYAAIGDKWRERAKTIEANPDLKSNYDREDATNRILAKQSRERALDNQYFEAAQDSGPEPVTLQDQEERFVQNFPDVAVDPEQMATAKENVDQQHRESFIEGGFPDNSPGVYDRAGEIARLRQAMAELKKGRSQVD